ncbi:hypothetical protein OAK38_00930 [Verrucomicrobia bacterium]|nr:hypothetical protein [Verrucomicrobiota bacterium]
MAQQLVFTSTPQGLEPGRSGYCTVARHKDLRHRLVRELERLSVYDFGQQTGSTRSDICIFRKMPLGSEEYYVLTKICDAGLDYTNRTNYLAHHLVLDGFEIATCPSPAEIFLNWNGWLRTWTDGPRYFGEEEEASFTDCKSSNLIPCQGWLQMTNDPGNAASLVSPDMIKPIVVEGKPESANILLTLFAESSALLKISLDAWDFSFTTFLQGNDDTKTFSWIGITGQPAGEKLKQGGLRNYLDLRTWSASVISDPVDPGFEYLARKGPQKIAVKKKPSTVSKAAFSDQELQRAKAAAPMAASAVPSGSTVFPQQSSGTSKSKKRRPWLLQLAVISTALCLLGGLIAGLALNWGDWFHDEDVVNTDPVVPPDPETPPDQPEPTFRTVAFDSPVQLDRVEYVRLDGKDRWLEWIDLKVGGSKPVRVNLSKKLRDQMGPDIEEMKEGEELQVEISRDEEENLTFKSVQKAPAPTQRGISRSIELDEKGSVSLSDDEKTMFFNSGDKTYPLALSLLPLLEQQRMRELYDAIQSGASIRFKPRVKDGRIVHFEEVALPSDEPSDPKPDGQNPLDPPKGKPVNLTAVKIDDLRLEADQKRIFIRVRGTTTLAYVFREEERTKITELVSLLKAGAQDADLKIHEDGKQITSLDFELPKLSSDSSERPSEVDPNTLRPETTIVFWIPGKSINGRWTIEPKDRYIFNHVELPGYLTEFLDAGIAQDDPPKAWMADFQPRLLVQRGAVGGVDFEPYSYEGDPDRLDPLRIKDFRLKQKVNGKNFYSFIFKMTKEESVQVSLETPETKNFIKKGKLLRFPNAGPSGGCLDMFFLSNLHGSLTDKQVLGESFTCRLGTLEISPPWLREGRGFTFLTPKSSLNPYLLALSVKSSVSPDKIRPIIDREPESINLKTFSDSELPEAFLTISSEAPLKGTIVSDQEYARKLQDQILLKQQEEDAVGTDNLTKFGNRQAWGPVFQYMKYARGNGYVFNYQKLGNFIYESTFQNLRKILEDARFKLLQSKLPADFYQTEALAYDVRLAKTFWDEVSKAVKGQIEESINRPRNYDDETAERDIDRLFGFLEQMLHAEVAFGFTDGEGLYDAMQDFRHSLSLSTNEASTIRKLQSETQKNSEKIRNNFSQSLGRFQMMEKNLTRYAQLGSSDLRLCSDVLSDRAKYAQFLAYYNTGGGGGSELDGLLEKVKARLTGPRLEMSQREAFINKVPWTLSVLKKTSAGGFVKESDFLLLAPPQIP